MSKARTCVSYWKSYPIHRSTPQTQHPRSAPQVLPHGHLYINNKVALCCIFVQPLMFTEPAWMLFFRWPMAQFPSACAPDRDCLILGHAAITYPRYCVPLRIAFSCTRAFGFIRALMNDFVL
jgi:hypothetical protein